jgi:L-2-hydroxyglutarate oxidase LhgO
MYYTPGSLKAKLCVEGNKLTYDYCDEHSIPYQRIGKLIVATTPTEVENLKTIYHRAVENKVVGVTYLSNATEIAAVEPFATGI